MQHYFFSINNRMEDLESLIDNESFYAVYYITLEKIRTLYAKINGIIDLPIMKIEKIYNDIMNIDGFNIKYVPNMDIDINNPNLKQILLEEYNKRLTYDIKICSTDIGPHKDDIEYYLNDKNLKYYGSQGQQRLAVLAFKLAEIEIFKKYKETTPILLLDDIFSELDDKKKNNLLKYINKNIQTIITTTDLNNLDPKLIKKSKLFNINNGNIVKIKEVKIDE